MVLDLGGAIRRLPLGLWLLLRVRLVRYLLGHHLAGSAHVLLKVCRHGEKGMGSVTTLRRRSGVDLGAGLGPGRGLGSA